jgi:Na+/phosphate symporter
MFLFGMEQMSEGLKAAAGDTLKDVLAQQNTIPPLPPIAEPLSG